MKRTFFISETQLQGLIQKLVKEQDIDIDSEEEFVEPESEYQDFGLDFEEDDEEEMFQKKMRSKFDKKNRPSRVDYGRMDWKKDYEKPYSPVRPTDLPLEKLHLLKKKPK